MNTTSYSKPTWRGTITLTNWNDESDTATTSAMTVTATGSASSYAEELVQKKVAEYGANQYDITDLFNMSLADFAQALTHYSLDCLESFDECCQACLAVLIDQGAGASGAVTHGIYAGYYNKLQAIESEIILRTQELEIIGTPDNHSGILQTIISMINDVHDTLDFEAYIGETLWKEFVAYRREDEYSNNNYVSDGLNNAEIIENAKRFYEAANTELYKSSTLQHSISASLANLLAMKEFENLTKAFDVGNWIYVIVNGRGYKLRIVSYEIDFGDVQNIDVEFSDVLAIQTGVSDIAATKTLIMSNANNQDMSFGDFGLLGKRWDDSIGSYSPEQVRLINSTLAFTDDYWATVKTALGKIVVDGEEKYGLIAENIYGEFGQFVTLNADTVTITGRIQDAAGLNYWDMETGDFHLSAYATKESTITDVDVEYAVGGTSSTAPTTGWSTGTPTWISGQYVWQRTKLTDGEGTITYSSPVCIQGAAGVSVTSVTEYYAVSSSSSTAPADASFSTDVPLMDATNKYLWNYEVTLYSDGSTAATTKHVIGVFGEDGDDGNDGVGINSITNYYLASPNVGGITTGSAGWTTTVQTVTKTDKYLWNYEVVGYTNNTSYTSTPCIIGVYGDTGAKGDTGVGIQSVTEYYAVSTSKTTAPTDNDFSTTVPTLDAINRYLWNYEVVTYTDSSTDTSSKCVIGVWGDAGVGISSIVEYYLATNMSTGVTTDHTAYNWTTTVQTISNSNKYLWNYEVVTYTDGNAYTSTPCIIGAYGDRGDRGVQGDGYFVYIRYSASADGSNMHAVWQTGDAYIGIYSGTDATAPATAASYTWSRFAGEDGAQGIPGQAGEDGDTYYVHFAYSDNYPAELVTIAGDSLVTKSGDALSTVYRFSTSEFDGAMWIGVYTDTNINDSSDPNDYTWSRIRGRETKTVEDEYYLSTSSTQCRNGGWSTNQPEWEDGHYLWTRSKITYQDGGSISVEYTDPILAAAINSANQAVTDLDNSLDVQGVFNRLTDNGRLQGIYMDNGNLYVNGTYIKAGTIDASIVTVSNMDASNITTGTLSASLIDVNDLLANNITATGNIWFDNGYYQITADANSNVRIYSFNNLNLESPFFINITGQRVDIDGAYVNVSVDAAGGFTGELHDIITLSGTSGNWIYEKTAKGHVRFYGVHSVTPTSWTANGSLYYSNVFEIAAPWIYSTNSNFVVAGSTANWLAYVANAGFSNSKVTFRLVSTTNRGTSEAVSVMLTCFGTI